MLTQDEKNALLARELSELRSRMSAMSDLVALLMAELAATTPNPAKHLETVIEGEKNAAYGAATRHVEITDALQKVLQEKAQAKKEVMDFAVTILGRIEAERELKRRE